MGWEIRGQRRYLYRNRRVNGRPVKEYVAADDRFGFGELMADDLDRLLRSQAKLRRVAREARAECRGRIDDLLAATAAANSDLRTLAEGVLYALGYRRHNRGEWRMRFELSSLRKQIDALQQKFAERKPLVNYTAPTEDAEAVELFAKARAGDAGAQDRIHALIRERKWLDWLGDIGRQATRQLVWRASGGDPVWEAGIAQKANALRDQLLGENPTVLEVLLARRVVNGWLAIHTLELELTLRPPAEARDRAHLDRALSRAQKRMTEAVRELARVRRLQAPAILAQLNLAATQTVVNAAVVPPAAAPPALGAGTSGTEKPETAAGKRLTNVSIPTGARPPGSGALAEV